MMVKKASPLTAAAAAAVATTHLPAAVHLLTAGPVHAVFCYPAGLESLVRSDKRFSPFTESLFSRSSVNTSREQLTAEDNIALNTNLAAFLRVLTNHFLAAAAFQVLEYCVRRYK